MTDGGGHPESTGTVPPAGAAPDVPHPAPGLEISAAAARDGKAVVSLEGGRSFEVSPATARLLALVDGRRDLATIAALLAAGPSPPIEAGQLREVIERTLRPMGLVHWGGADARPATGRPPSAMWLRLPLVGEDAVNAAAAPFVPLFGRAAALLAGGLVLAAHAWFYRGGFRHEQARELFHLSEWVPLLLLYQISVGVHELGHAAALRSRGRRAGAIGFGFYRLFPVFFTDVSRAWQLTRGGRAAVDAGGMYLQLLFAGALIALHAATHSVAAARAVALIDVSLVANLNPILRMDGYWLVSDLSEIRDLRRRSIEVMRGWFGRRPAGAAPPSRFLVAYTLFSLAYFAAFALWILGRFVPLVASQMRGAWRALGAAGGPLAALEPALFLVAALGLLVGIALIGWQWLRARAAPGAGRARDAAGPAEPPGG